ncbi:MAG: hypothetical protein U0795_08800 [Pirellulales bacterium]
MSRRAKLEAMLAEEPHDKFLRYSLGLELAKEGDHQRALEFLDGLTRDEPPYVPAFFMAAQQLAARQQIDDARTYLRNGIESARQQGDMHAAGEMSEFLMSLGSLP